MLPSLVKAMNSDQTGGVLVDAILAIPLLEMPKQRSSTCGAYGCNRFLEPESVRVTYDQSELSYVGYLFGPASTLTAELRDFSFSVLFADKLISGLTSLTRPAQPVSSINSNGDPCF